LGLWCIAIDFLGIPATWKLRLYVATGGVLMVIYLLHLAGETILKLASGEAHQSDIFSQNGKNGNGKSGNEPTIHRIGP
jgi:hypothetical protein